MSNKDYALQYAEIGLSVIPISPTSKRPLAKWRRFQQEPADEGMIEEWWSHWPEAEIGVVTGEVSNLVVVDCDNEEAYERMLSEGIVSPIQARTRRGHHIFFSHPGHEVKNTTNWMGIEGVDVRGDGGYVKVAPSKNYKWDLIPGTTLTYMHAEMHPWVYGHVGKQEEVDFEDTEREGIKAEFGAGERNDGMTRVAGAIINEHDDKWGKDILRLVWAENEKRCNPPLTKDEIITITKSVMNLHKANNPDEFNSRGQRIKAVRSDAEIAMAENKALISLSTATYFDIDPPEREYLVDKIIPAGLPGVLASPGGVGKTFMLLDLAVKVSMYSEDDEVEWMGHRVRKRGRSILFLGEDDAHEISRRLMSLDPTYRRVFMGEGLTIISVPEMENTMSFGVKKFDALEFTPEAHSWREVLTKDLPDTVIGYKDLALLVIDPMQSFFDWRFDEDNIAADKAMKWAQSIAVATGAAVVFTHHLRKEDGGMHSPTTPQGAVGKIRGASNVVNSARFAIPIWRPNDDIAETVMAKLAEIDPDRFDVTVNNAIFMGGLGKENFGGDVSTHWLHRNKITGLLEDVTHLLREEEIRVRDKTAAGSVVDYLRDHGATNVKDIAEALDKTEKNVRNQITSAVDKKRIYKVETGVYDWVGHHPDMDQIYMYVYERANHLMASNANHPEFGDDIKNGRLNLRFLQQRMKTEASQLLWQEAVRLLVDEGCIEIEKERVSGKRSDKGGRWQRFLRLKKAPERRNANENPRSSVDDEKDEGNQGDES
jgi:hypothetical protein